MDGLNPIKGWPLKRTSKCGGRGPIIPHIGHFRNDTFGPFFDNRAMGYENMVHYWHFKKEIRSLDAFVKL